MKKILILTGPNLNMLGLREPEIYGTQTFKDIKKICDDVAKKQNMKIDFRQSNHEGDLIDWIQKAMKGYSGVIINAGAYTHTSLAIHDALKLLQVPVIEVHISDPKQREPFRHYSFIEPLAAATIAGKGAQGYAIALETLNNLLNS
jgi:3-dehydroquinate dehydratase II